MLMMRTTTILIGGAHTLLTVQLPLELPRNLSIIHQPFRNDAPCPAHLIQLSTEEIIDIESVLLPDTPEEKEDIPHEEWVSAVAVLAWTDRASWVLNGS